MSDFKNKPESFWKEKLTPEQYKVVRQKGTERAFSGALYYNHDQGVYECIACGQPLFASDAKFESGTGWPSFDQPINLEHVELHEDNSFFMRRTEVNCKNCGAHLGHVFNDGPRETTGMRYCSPGRGRNPARLNILKMISCVRPSLRRGRATLVKDVALPLLKPSVPKGFRIKREQQKKNTRGIVTRSLLCS